MQTGSDPQHFPQILFSLLTDPSLWEVIALSLRVSLSATFFAVIIGIPLAAFMVIVPFRGKRFLQILVDALMALPPVVVGLIVYLLLSRSGPLGVWQLLYTPTAMIIAQSLLVTPLVIALASQIFRERWQHLAEQLIMLGFGKLSCVRVLISEAKLALLTVLLAAFGRAIAEIGTVMIVGGNIEGQTRVMTTAIARETQQGNLMLAMALGVILIVLAFAINIIIHSLKPSRPQGKHA